MQMTLKFIYRFLLSLPYEPFQQLNPVLEICSHGWHQISYLPELNCTNLLTIKSKSLCDLHTCEQHLKQKKTGVTKLHHYDLNNIK